MVIESDCFACTFCIALLILTKASGQKVPKTLEK